MKRSIFARSMEESPMFALQAVKQIDDTLGMTDVLPFILKFVDSIQFVLSLFHHHILPTLRLLLCVNDKISFIFWFIAHIEHIETTTTKTWQ